MSKFTEFLEATNKKSLTLINIEELIKGFSNLKIVKRLKDEIRIINKNTKNEFNLTLDFNDNEFYFIVDGPSLKNHSSYSTETERLNEIKLKKYLRLANEITDLISKKNNYTTVKLF